MKLSRGKQMVAAVLKQPPVPVKRNLKESNQDTVQPPCMDAGPNNIRDWYETVGEAEYAEFQNISPRPYIAKQECIEVEQNVHDLDDITSQKKFTELQNVTLITPLGNCNGNGLQDRCLEFERNPQGLDEMAAQLKYDEIQSVSSSKLINIQAGCVELEQNIEGLDEIMRQAQYTELQSVSLNSQYQECNENIIQAACTEVVHNNQGLEEIDRKSKHAVLSRITTITHIEDSDVNLAPVFLDPEESNLEELHANIPEASTSAIPDDDKILLDTRSQKRKVNVEESSISELSETDNNSVPSTANALNQSIDGLSRKRQRNPKNWKRNSQKILKMAGKEYQSRSGRIIRARRVREVNCKCNYKCRTKIDEPMRKQMLADYLSLDSDRARWAFISKNVSRIPVKRRYSGDSSKRGHTLKYTMMCGEERVQVCKQFFLATYDISGKKVETALNKLTPSSVTEMDRRGHKEPPNKKSEEAKNIIRAHIKSLPVVASHYCRSNSKRKYLPFGLSEARIYLDYVAYCKEHEVQPEKFSFHKFIFVSEFNYGFHTPKKDQCDFCTQHKNKSNEERARNEDEYNLHLTRKEEARELKKLDKALARIDSNVSCFAMDLEKILLTPSLQVGQLYYKKKLKTYNFTVYDLASRQATNYMWHEGSGTKGASEIATCLWKLLVSIGPKKEVTLYSDTASGQNRNSVVSTMFLRAVEQLPIDKINQKFMESGHSEMECDSVHSTIETRGRQVDVFTPDGWYMVARTAKTNKPYHKVVELEYSDFLDYKKYSSQVMTNKIHSEDGEKMKWLKVKWFQYRKGEPTTIYYKYRLSDNDFKSLNIQRRRRRNISVIDVPRLYCVQPKTDRRKLNDLLKLCQGGSIPSTYHDFYQKKLEPEDGPVHENSISGSDETDEGGPA